MLGFRLISLQKKVDMPRDGTATRDKILDVGKTLALRQGHVATSVDEIIEEAGITKGTFFYHFKTKQDLAVALIEKFAENDVEILKENLANAEKLSKDPLQQLLIFVGLIQKLHENLDASSIGCLFASYSYENQLIDKNVKAIVSDTILEWRNTLSDKIKKIIKQYPPRQNVNPNELADMFTVTLEGAYVFTRLMHQPELVNQHLEHYKNYIESLFN